MSEELAVYDEGKPGQLIALALDRQADPAVLSKLMDLQERWEAQNARKEFVLAMSAFKQEAPSVLKKGDKVDFQSAKGRTTYNYANLGSIVQEITAILGKHSLSATWQTCQDEKGNITVTCNVTHAAGHRESVTLTGPPDDSGNKNRIQAIGSAVTYLQRYTLLAALGLATSDDDDDGRGHRPDGQRPPVKQPQEKKPEGSSVLTIVTGIEQVTMKSGNKNGKDWTLYTIHAGEKYTTFDKKHAEAAKAASDSGMVMVLTYAQTDKGRNLVSIAEHVDRQPGEEG